MAEPNSKTEHEIESELLTAYLDGELSDTECIAVEKRLADDPSFHQKMRELQSAWEMLDSLPLIQPDSHFVQTTVEMAIAGHSRKRPSYLNLLKGLMLLLIPAVLFGLSYFLKRESIEQPERELVYNLPLIENHDRYTKVIFEDQTTAENTPEELAKEGVVFLKSLYSKGLIRELDDLFSVEPREESLGDFADSSEPPAPQLIKDRSDRLSRMTDEQRDELFEKKRKFESLNTRQQDTLRAFHKLLSEEPERAKLVEMLASYYDWLKILGASQRVQILDTPLIDDQRLMEIGRITRKQAVAAFGTFGSTKLPLDDAERFYQWYDFSIRFYEPEIRERTGAVLTRIRNAKGLPTNEMVIDRIKSGPIEQLVEFLMRNDRDYFGELLCNNANQTRMGIGDLRKIVSDEARVIIDDPSFRDLDRQELILKWIEAANQARFPIKPDALKSFYAELTQEQRDDLDNQDPKDWYNKLTLMYWEANIGQRSAPSEEEAFENFLRQSGFDTEFGITDDES